MAQDLSPKQSAFCREYVLDYNGRQSAIRAGYSAKTALDESSDKAGRHIRYNFSDALGTSKHLGCFYRDDHGDIPDTEFALGQWLYVS